MRKPKTLLCRFRVPRKLKKSWKQKGVYRQMYKLTLSRTLRHRLYRLCSFGSLYADSLYQYYAFN